MAEDKEQSPLTNFSNFKDELNKEVIALTALFTVLFIKFNEDSSKQCRKSKERISIFDSQCSPQCIFKNLLLNDDSCCVSEDTSKD